MWYIINEPQNILLSKRKPRGHIFYNSIWNVQKREHRQKCIQWFGKCWSGDWSYIKPYSWEENVLILIMLMVASLDKITKDHSVKYLKMEVLWHVKYISMEQWVGVFKSQRTGLQNPCPTKKQRQNRLNNLSKVHPARSHPTQEKKKPETPIHVTETAQGNFFNLLFYGLNLFFHTHFNTFCLLSPIPSFVSFSLMIPISSSQSPSRIYAAFCFVLWSISYMQDSICAYGFGTIHWSLMCPLIGTLLKAITVPLPEPISCQAYNRKNT